MWSAAIKQVKGPDLLLRDLPGRRWQEIEVHLVDLDIGTGCQSWSDEFVGLFFPGFGLRSNEESQPGSNVQQSGLTNAPSLHGSTAARCHKAFRCYSRGDESDALPALGGNFLFACVD